MIDGLRLIPRDQCTGVKQRRGSASRTRAPGQRPAHLAHRVLPGADEASVTYVRDRRPSTPAASSELARRLDEAQYEQHSGPCLTAAANDTVVSIVDTATDQRFADWATVARVAGIRSVLSLGLPTRGSLNLYGRAPGAFDDDTLALARTFARSAAAALANAHLYETTVTVAEQLREAMEHRAVIEQAKGILMGERRCTADEAFAILAGQQPQTPRHLRRAGHPYGQWPRRAAAAVTLRIRPAATRAVVRAEEGKATAPFQGKIRGRPGPDRPH